MGGVFETQEDARNAFLSILSPRYILKVLNNNSDTFLSDFMERDIKKYEDLIVSCAKNLSIEDFTRIFECGIVEYTIGEMF